MSLDGSRKHRVLLGGGIGAGKSSVAALFVEAGFALIESDSVGAGVLAPDTTATRAVARTWPEVVHDGAVDRAGLAAIVFADPDELVRLEAITHPRIRDEIERLADLATGNVVVEVPLTTLHISGDWMRVALLADENTRVQRAIARGGAPDDIRRRVASQVSDHTWAVWADIVIVNNGELSETSRDILALIDGLDA